MSTNNLICGDACQGGANCTNSRIYISNLPKGCTSDQIVEVFKNLGVIARERPQGRGVFPDMMPFRVKFYGNDDCLLQYEDSHAAHAAPSFFDGFDLDGSKLHVEMAEKKPNQGLAPEPYNGGGRGGSRGGGRGGGGRQGLGYNNRGGPPRDDHRPPRDSYDRPPRDDYRPPRDSYDRPQRDSYDRRPPPPPPPSQQQQQQRDERPSSRSNDRRDDYRSRRDERPPYRGGSDYYDRRDDARRDDRHRQDYRRDDRRRERSRSRERGRR